MAYLSLAEGKLFSFIDEEEHLTFTLFFLLVS